MKQTRKALSFLLILAVLSSSLLLPAQAYGNAGGTASGFFDRMYSWIFDGIDRLRLRRAERSGEAVFTLGSGDVSFTVRGSERADDGTFRIDGDFSATVYGINRRFNRMTFRYTSDEPLQLRVTYRELLLKKTTLFYLEAAENGVFRGLIESYLRGRNAGKLVSLQIGTCTGNAADFSLHAIETERIAPPDEPVCFLENARFKLGVKLAWGGGIHYLEDRSATAEGLTNLINQYDTGRLVQQSYYGSGPIEGVYDPGVAFNTVWCYNPVQGGDQYGNASRLIDFAIRENAVYVKAQPQDWARDNGITPSYMENTYTLFADRVRVDNRFVDFSGMTHPFGEQELPAFYTVSYLSRFIWYNGTQPWQNDTLTYRDDLKFWGDYVDECKFPYKNGNSETWCAWVSPESGYGVGLYVPNVDILKAGRYEFNGSKDAGNIATNYVAPLDVLRITSYAPIEYSYLLTAGSTEQIRALFKENKDFADNASLHENYRSARTD